MLHTAMQGRFHSSFDTLTVLPKARAPTAFSFVLALSPREETFSPCPRFWGHLEPMALVSTTALATAVEIGGDLVFGETSDSLTEEQGKDFWAYLKRLCERSIFSVCRTLAITTLLRATEQVVIAAMGTKFYNEWLAMDPTDVRRDIDTSDTPLTTRLAGSARNVQNGLLTSVLYHVSVATVDSLLWVFDKHTPYQKKEHNDTKERLQYLWSRCCFATMSTGICCGVGTLLNPGIGTQVGFVAGKLSIYLM